MNLEEPNLEEPRVLIISNNALSDTKNNGKTLASFFKNFNPANVAQLYFNSELPSGSEIYNYFQITDRDVIRASLKSQSTCGRVVKLGNIEDTVANESFNKHISKIKKNNLTRIFREFFWKSGKWNSDQLNRWLDKFSPDIIFFCAGDSGFAYDVSNYITKKFNAKLVIYITDDYILPRKTLNPLWWFRRNNIFRKMKICVNSSDLFLTISEKMKRIYKDYLGQDSIVAVNMCDSMKEDSNNEQAKSVINLVYAGGLHYNRYKTLELLVKSIKRYNNQLNNSVKLHLKIYSNKKPDSKILSKLDVKGTSTFGGSLNYAELKNELNRCDIPVHVESFDRRSIESTRLSISTKIPEYLSLGKPILAIGPKEVASMEYLQDVAFCVNNADNLYERLSTLVTNEKLKSSLSSLALKRYNQNHNVDKLTMEFKKNILQLSIKGH